MCPNLGTSDMGTRWRPPQGRLVVVDEHVRAELPGQPVSVGRARSLLLHALRDWDLEPLQDTVLLLVSELATNAVLHARSDFAVEATRTTEGVRVSVSDC